MISKRGWLRSNLSGIADVGAVALQVYQAGEKGPICGVLILGMGRPSSGRVPPAPPDIWAFLSSLGEHGFSSSG